MSSSGSAGAANPSISGGSGLDNQYVIDGVNVTNQGYGALGSYSIIFGSLGNATPFDFVQEVQVKTGGYEAEFGQATGGVVNVITKSGSNDVHGSVFGYARPRRARGRVDAVSNRQRQRADRSARRSGWRRRRRRCRSSRIGCSSSAPSTRVRTRRRFRHPTGFRSAASATSTGVGDTMTYSAKATWQLTSAHRIDASFFGDPSKGDNGPQRASRAARPDTSSFSSLTYGGHNQTVRYNGVLPDNWLRRSHRARALNTINETPIGEHLARDRSDGDAEAITGGIGFYEAATAASTTSTRQGDQCLRRPSDQVWRPVRRRRPTTRSISAPARPSRRRTAGRPPPARRYVICRRQRSGRSTG